LPNDFGGVRSDFLTLVAGARIADIGEELLAMTRNRIAWLIVIVHSLLRTPVFALAQTPPTPSLPAR
jgi:hypothetical protein